MFHTVKFYGSSDDLIEVEGGAPGCDEYNEEDASFLVVCDKSSAVVRVTYVPGGVWQVAMAPVDEGISMPDATITLGGPYSAALTIQSVVHITQKVDRDA